MNYNKNYRYMNHNNNDDIYDNNSYCNSHFYYLQFFFDFFCYRIPSRHISVNLLISSLFLFFSFYLKIIHMSSSLLSHNLSALPSSFYFFSSYQGHEETITTVEGTDPQGQGQGNSISSSCLVATG